MTSHSQHDSQQKEHFDNAKHQYIHGEIPLHTQIEQHGVIKEFANVPPNEVVLDFGAGTGRISLALAKNGHKVLATDLSETSLTNLQNEASNQGISGIDVTTTLPDEPVAGVTGADVLHHVDMNDIVPQLAAVTKPGGKAVFSEPNCFNLFWYPILAVTSNLWIERRIVFLNRQNLVRTFQNAGFSRVDIVGLGLFPLPFFNKWPSLCRINVRLGNLPVLRHFAYRHRIVAIRDDPN